MAAAPDRPFVISAWPPAKGYYTGIPEEYIPPGGFSDMHLMDASVSGFPERTAAPSALVPKEDGTYGRAFYFTGSSKVVFYRNKTGATGLYTYSAPTYTKVRGGTGNPVMAEMNDRLFVAGFTDTDGSLGSELQMYDGTNWLVPRITRPDCSGTTITEGTGGNLNNGSYYGFKITFVDSDGNESQPHDFSTDELIQGLTGSNNKLTLSDIPTGDATEGIAARRIYMPLGQQNEAAVRDATFYYLAEIADNVTTEYAVTESEDDLDLTLAAPEYGAGWPSGVNPTGVVAWGGRLYAWTADKVYWSGRHPALTADDVMAQASAKYGLYEHLYWDADNYRSPGEDGDSIVRVLGWNGSLYCFKYNSIWRFDQRSISPDAWRWVQVHDSIGAISYDAVHATHEGMWFVWGALDSPAQVYMFDSGVVSPVGGNIFGAITGGAGNVACVWSLGGEIFLSGTGTGKCTYAFNPQTRLWSKVDASTMVYHAEARRSAWPYALETRLTGASDYTIDSRLSSVVRTSAATGGYCTTGRLIAGAPDMPKRFNRLRFQVSTSAATTVTVTGYTDIETSGTQIYSGSINAPLGKIETVGIPAALVRGRYLKLKFQFTSSAWGRLDGFSVYGEYDPPRKTTD